MLWSGPDTVLSHSTALVIQDLCDVNSADVEVTVPRARRIRHADQVATVHREDPETDAVDWWEGVPTVTAATAIAQAIRTGVAFHLLAQAINTAQAHGQINVEAEATLRVKLVDDRHGQHPLIFLV